MRARTLLHTLPLLCSAALLACSGPLPWRDDAPAATAPDLSADAAYQRGRALHLAHDDDAAIAAYRAAVRLDATHVNARNGLAVAYAERQDYAQAIAIWHDLTAGATLASGADSAYLFANLGYAHMLAGELDAAVPALEKACLLDPLNGRAWQYLGETLVKLGDDVRGQQMLRQAEILRTHDLRADYAVAAGGAHMPAIEQALTTATRADGAWAVVDVVRKDSGLLELRRSAPRRRPQLPTPATPPTQPPSAPLPAVALLEISNGNGREGMARRLARALREPGLKLVRLSNQKGFDVRRTRIEYQPPFRAAAERLALRVGASRPVEAGAPARADVRLVLGRDLGAERVRAVAQGEDLRLAQAQIDRAR
jgi:hypothetical protein